MEEVEERKLRDYILFDRTYRWRKRRSLVSSYCGDSRRWSNRRWAASYWGPARHPADSNCCRYCLRSTRSAVTFYCLSSSGVSVSRCCSLWPIPSWVSDWTPSGAWCWPWYNWHCPLPPSTRSSCYVGRSVAPLWPYASRCFASKTADAPCSASNRDRRYSTPRIFAGCSLLPPARPRMPKRDNLRYSRLRKSQSVSACLSLWMNIFNLPELAHLPWLWCEDRSLISRQRDIRYRWIRPVWRLESVTLCPARSCPNRPLLQLVYFVEP